MNMTKDRFYDWLGYAGIVLIQGATFPAMLQYLLGDGTSQLPPLTMTLLIWAGLALFLARGVQRKDMVAIVSNSIGFILQSVMLALITLS